MSQLLNPRQRQIAYAVYALLGVVIGAVQTGYNAASTGTPTWLHVVTAVFAFIGTGLGLTAAANVDTSTGPKG